MSPRFTAGRLLRWGYVGDAEGILGRKGLRPSTPVAARAVVVGGGWCREWLGDLPPTSRRDLAGAVGWEVRAHCPFPVERVAWRERWEADRVRVNAWAFRTGWTERLRRGAWLAVPESAVVAEAGPPGPVLVSWRVGGRTRYVFKDAQGWVRGVGFRGEIGEDEVRRMVGGEAADCPHHHLGEDDAFFRWLSGAVAGVPVRRWNRFLRGPRPEARAGAPRLGRVVLVGVPLAFAAYAAGRAAVVDRAVARWEAEERAAQTRLAEVLRRKDELGALEARIAALGPVFAQDRSVVALVNELDGVLPEGTKLWEFQVAGTVVRMRGVCPDAVALLEVLRGVEGVSGIELEGGVVRDEGAGLDRFAVKFLYGAPP
ncbi:hypothetical protein [Deferrisoma palaeochoriense]